MAAPARPTEAGGTEASEPGTRRPWLGLGLLLALCAVYVALAGLAAVPDSRLVLATAGGSPEWLLGPLSFLGLGAASGPAAGPLYYAGLCLALALYAGVLALAASISRRAAVLAVVSLHLLFALAPPLLSQDVFSYIAYARLGVVHGLSPYTHAPLDIPSDPVFGFAGSKDAVSVYGPLFTLLTYPLAPLGVPAALWLLKAVAALSSLGIVALVWRGAESLGRDPRLAALFVGLNPDVLVHVVGGAHNEALVMLLVTAGLVAFIAGRASSAAVLATAAAGLKASAGLVVPFLIVGAAQAGKRDGPSARGSSHERRRPGASASSLLRPAATALATAGLIALMGLLGFGREALDALDLINSNQGRSSRFSLPYKTAQGLAAIGPGDRLDYRSGVRLAYALGFGVTFLVLLWRTWRGADPIRMAGWATLAILLASAWLVPWYLLWLLPLAALAHDSRLRWATVAFTAWTLAIAIPFT